MRILDKKVIPKGIYCYVFEEEPRFKDGFKGKIKYCPYFSNRVINGVNVPWCLYLNLGGMSNNWTKNDWKQVRKYYKTEKAMDKELPLFLLWDSCKECGENID